MGLSLAKQLISPQNMFSVLIFGSSICAPLIPCHYFWNGRWPWLEQHRNMESRQSCWTTYMMRIKESERETIFLIFRWYIVLHSSYQADEIVTEIEEWKQKVLGICVESFSRVLKCVGDISCILEKLYYMNLKLDYS